MTPPKSFETYDHKTFRLARAKAQRTELPPGAYTLQCDDNGPYFKAHKMTTDELIHSDDPREVALREEVRTFFSSAHLYERHGFTHRRGVLLHGPAGSGKSCLLRSFCEEQVANGRHVLIIDHSDEPHFIHAMLGYIQERNESASVIVVIEELEEYVGRRGEHSLLALLDGEMALKGALVVATTNYPEKLNKRILNRPRRFDRVLYIGMPGEAVRREYFQKKLFIEAEELDEWVGASNNFSFAAMADLVISNKCLGIPLQKAAASIAEMMDANPNSADEQTPTPIAKTRLLVSTSAEKVYNDLMDSVTPDKPHPFVAPIIDRIDESAGIVANHDG